MSGTLQETHGKKSTTTERHARATTMGGTRFATHDEIARAAHALYVRSGYPSGRDVEFWLEAERQLREEQDV